MVKEAEENMQRLLKQREEEHQRALEQAKLQAENEKKKALESKEAAEDDAKLVKAENDLETMQQDFYVVRINMLHVQQPGNGRTTAWPWTTAWSGTCTTAWSWTGGAQV